MESLSTKSIELLSVSSMELDEAEELSPMVIAITGASGNVAYSLAFMIAEGRMFGSSRSVVLHLIGRPSSKREVEGLKLELDDSAFELLQEVKVFDNWFEGFRGIDVALLVGGCPRTPGMERRDLIQKNAMIFQEQGRALEASAKSSVKVCVVGNPCNTMALICAKNAPSIPMQNFTSITRLDQNRTSVQVSKKLGVNSKSISNVIIWGNHSSTQYPDLEHAAIIGKNAKSSIKLVVDAIKDQDWIQNELIPLVQKRGAQIIQCRTKGAAASTAIAICDHMHDWLIGTAEGKIVSMGVYSEGNKYGIDQHLMFSFPCKCKNGVWTIVNDLEVSESAMEKIRISEAELMQEKLSASSVEEDIHLN